jgi:DNA-binding response OmpR family regulator
VSSQAGFYLNLKHSFPKWEGVFVFEVGEVKKMTVKQVLVIEDDPHLSGLFKMVLQFADFQADVARTGADGMARLSKCIPDVVILDMHLPDIPGEQIFQMMAGLDQASRVIICSADISLVKAYLAKGASAMSKPVRIDELTAEVIRIAGRQPVSTNQFLEA